MTHESPLSSLDLSHCTVEDIADATRAVLSAQTEGVYFRVQPTVDVTAAPDAPIKVLAVEVSPSDRTMRLPSRGVLTATHLALGRTWAARWEPPRSGPGAGRRPAREPPTEEDDDPETVVRTATPHQTDLRAQMPDLPARPGTLLVRLHLADQVFGPEFVTFGGGVDDPEVKAYLDWMATQQPAPALPAPSAAVDNVADEWTPAVPEQPGITLVLQRVSLSGPGRQLALRGSFNLPIAPHQLIAPSAMDRTLLNASLLARLSITLVFVSHGSDEPSVLPLHLDASDFSPPGPDGRLHARGVFRAELFAHTETPRLLGRYSVYAFAHEHMAGPHSLTLVGEELVPLVPPR